MGIRRLRKQRRNSHEPSLDQPGQAFTASPSQSNLYDTPAPISALALDSGVQGYDQTVSIAMEEPMESDRQPSAVDDIHDDDFVPGEQNNPLIPNANEDSPELLEASDEHDMDDNNGADEKGEDSSNNPSNDTEVEIQLQQSGGTSGPPRKAVTVLFTGRNMSAVALLMGTSCLTVRQYVDVRKFINYEIDGDALMPSYPTVLYTLYSALYDVCFARHIFIHEEVNVLAAGVTTMVREQADSGETPMETVLVTLPSAWALRDASKMRELINTTMQMYQRPRISNYFETQMGKQGRLMNESSLLSEYKIVNSLY